MKNILYFLRQLCVNNNREWFNDNRKLYLEQKESFETIVSQLITEISKFDATVKDLSVKDCTYRINRDTRFSDDKTPYKNHFGAFIAPGGKKACTAGYYIHIEPDNSLLAGGNYMPPSDILFQLRSHIFENGKQFSEILSNPNFTQVYKTLEDEKKLKGMPRGFSKDFEYADLLKYTSYTVMHQVSDDFIETKDLFSYSIDTFKIMKDFNVFLNKALIK